MKLIKSFAYAWNGLIVCFRGEQNFRIHVAVSIVVLVLGWLFRISNSEWLATGFCIAFVLTMEMLNTAIEKLCDVVHKGLHPGIKKVKDIAAAAVLVSALFSFATGLVIFLPKIFLFLRSI